MVPNGAIWGIMVNNRPDGARVIPDRGVPARTGRPRPRRGTGSFPGAAGPGRDAGSMAGRLPGDLPGGHLGRAGGQDPGPADDERGRATVRPFHELGSGRGGARPAGTRPRPQLPARARRPDQQRGGRGRRPEPARDLGSDAVAAVSVADRGHAGGARRAPRRPGHLTVARPFMRLRAARPAVRQTRCNATWEKGTCRSWSTRFSPRWPSVPAAPWLIARSAAGGPPSGFWGPRLPTAACSASMPIARP